MINRRDWFLSVGGIAGALTVGREAEANDNSLEWLDYYYSKFCPKNRTEEAEYLYLWIFAEMIPLFYSKENAKDFKLNTKDFWLGAPIIVDSFDSVKSETIGCIDFVVQYPDPIINEKSTVPPCFKIDMAACISLKEHPLVVQDIISEKIKGFDCLINNVNGKGVLSVSKHSDSSIRTAMAFLLDKDKKYMSRSLFYSEKYLEMIRKQNDK